MKLGAFLVILMVFINLCTGLPRNMEKDGFHSVTTLRQKIIRNLMSGTDGRTGPPSNDHQCPLGTYPNCQGVPQSTQGIAQDVGGN
uniref:Uncharacterized protein n=1 Tax=Leersia perrieri TaxID=77586 RepID=A0A0D9W2I3_9ORYZ